MDRLGPHREVWAVDLPGFGGSLWPTQALRARRALPEADHIWLRGCGHVPMSDDPDLVTRVLLEGSAAETPQKAVASAIG
jgi:pimeloyl-ACP methyl ester carboxylesterase